jgi:hypothetical protein
MDKEYVGLSLPPETIFLGHRISCEIYETYLSWFYDVLLPCLLTRGYPKKSASWQHFMENPISATLLRIVCMLFLGKKHGDTQ